MVFVVLVLAFWLFFIAVNAINKEEMCGDFRVSHGYGARVILLSRSGKVLDSDFGDKSQKPDPKMVEKVTDVLTNKYKVEVKLGTSGAQFIRVFSDFLADLWCVEMSESFILKCCIRPWKGEFDLPKETSQIRIFRMPF